MFHIKVENYKNDYTKFYEDKSFQSLDDLKQYLLCEYHKRDTTSQNSPYWHSPIGTSKEKDGSFKGWVRINGCSTNTYDLWLKKVSLDDGTIIFDEHHYCSPKFSTWLNELNQEISKKPLYGDF